ncbi:hypothetical protein AB0Y01_14285 [Enterococcus hirae]|uniref:hypothetical protein n=1 Tax=Enterococcus hirae TaxID=1354 RepID=UPI003F1F8E5B
MTGEPYLYITSYNNLSTGQRFRFCLAKALSENYKKIYIDEYCSYLDRNTAKLISYNLKKISKKKEISFMVVTAHDDLDDYLCPDKAIELDLSGRVKEINQIKEQINIFEDFLIFDGTYDDYLEMEQFHYFDNSSEEVNKDFSAKYYILIYREQLVGVIVLKKPYPSNQDDAEFIHLNNNILILDRIILHPLVSQVHNPV